MDVAFETYGETSLRLYFPSLEKSGVEIAVRSHHDIPSETDPFSVTVPCLCRLSSSAMVRPASVMVFMQNYKMVFCRYNGYHSGPLEFPS